MRTIESLNVTAIALVKDPANGQPFAVIEAHGPGHVLGCVLRPGVEDTQGDVVSAAVIAKALESWAIGGRVLTQGHDGPAMRDVQVVQCGTVDPQAGPMRMGGVVFTPGTWFLEVACGAATMKLIRAGKLMGFSIEGTALVRDSEQGDELMEVDVADFTHAVVKGIVDGLGLKHPARPPVPYSPAWYALGRR